MRAAWRGLAIEAIDYEIVRLGGGNGRLPLGLFSDVHHIATPIWRLVSGYLSFEEDEISSALVLRSHGHRIGHISPLGDSESEGVVITFEQPLLAGPDSLWSNGGVAVVPDAGTVANTDGHRVELRGGSDWGATFVHGPAEAKIQNRIRLLRSLERVGGRNG